MKIYDKAKWQIENGIDEKNTIAHFSFIFDWLKKNSLLSEYGLEIGELGAFDESSLTNEMVTKEGEAFLDHYYDSYIGRIDYGIREDSEYLDRMLGK